MSLGRASWGWALACVVAAGVAGWSGSGAAQPSEGCGEPGMAPCPLQAWMRSQLGAQLARRDFPAIASAFERLAASGPKEGYSEWATHARTGLEAARSKDLAQVRAACRACHDDYRARYRKELRGAPPPP